jgi:short-subunit dehydrogenase
VAPTLITHLFLEMLESYTPSYILNVSSLASFFYLPKKQVYGGTKSYLVSFSKSLRRELIQKNIYVSVVCPGGMNTNAALTVSNFNQKGFNRWCIMNPEEVARITIDKMLKKKEVIIPGKWNRFFIILDHFLPTFIKEWITQLVIKKTKVYKNPVTSLIPSLKTAV